MLNNKLTYHFEQFINEFKSQLTEEVATSVINALKESNDLLSGLSQKDVFLSTKEAAELFNISPFQIRKLRRKHSDFPATKIGTSVRYKQGDLEQFFSNNLKK